MRAIGFGVACFRFLYRFVFLVRGLESTPEVENRPCVL